MFITPHTPDKYFSSWAQYSILIPANLKKDEIMKKLSERDIPTMVYYKIPVHLQKGYLKYGYTRGDFQISEESSERIMSIPMHPYLTKKNQDLVISALNETV